MKLKKMQRLLAVFLLIGLLWAVPLMAQAADGIIASGTAGDNVTWALYEDGRLVFSGTGATQDVESYVNPYWCDYEEVRYIIFEEGITRIGTYFFNGADTHIYRLKSVTIPKSLKEIGEFAFQEINCNYDVLISDLSKWCSIKFENDDANPLVNEGDLILNGSVVENLVIPGTVKSISEWAFANCVSLKTVTIPKTVKNIGSRSFVHCSYLEKVIFEGDAPEIGEYAFINSAAYSYYPENNKTWTDEVMQGTGEYLKWVPYNPTVDNVLSDAFPGDTSDGVARWKYDEETGVLSFFGYGSMPSWLSMADSQYRGWDPYRGSVKSVVIGEGVTSVGSYAFYSCQNIDSVSLPSTIISIGEGAFRDIHELKEIVIPAAVNYIEHLAFSHCPSLEKVTFKGDMPEELQLQAFWNGYYTMVYPAHNQTWEQEDLSVYGSGLTWEPSHPYDWEYTVTAEPSCTEEGQRNSTCRECGYSFAEKAPALGHDFSNATPEFNANERTHSYKCTRCEERKTENCTMNETVVREATINSHGMKEYTCTVCGGGYQQEYAYRLSGDDRCSTAYSVADQMKTVQGIEKYDAILIASGDSFADALAGSCLAAEKNASILLYRSKSIADNVDYIQKNLTSSGTVYILGGTAAVPKEMEDALANFRVKRLSGNTRFDTNLEILKEAGVTGGEILVATGWDFADSLSASAVGKPILLVNSITGKLTENQKEFLSGLEDATFTIIGGTAAVGEELAAELAAYGEVDRVWGNTREETSVKVAERYFADPDRIVLAYSRNFPDGLCGGPLAYALGAPLILTNTGAEGTAADYVAANGITKGAVLGGTAVLSDETIAEVFALN